MAAHTPTDPNALRRFGQMPEGRLVVAVLRERLASYDEKLRRSIGVHLHQLQGRAIELEELISLLEPEARQPVQPKQPKSLAPFRVNHMAD